MSAIPKQQFCSESKTECSASQANSLFLRYLHAVTKHASIKFRGLSESDREEAVAESVAAAFVNVRNAVDKHRHSKLTPSTVANFAVLHTLNGRHIGGSTDTINDVLSRRAQRQRGFKVLGLDWDDSRAYNCMTDPTSPVWRQSLHCDLRTSIPEQAAFRIDWSTFLRSQSSRTRTALALLAAGHSQTEVADRLGVTPSAVCQRIKRAEREWSRLQRLEKSP